MKIKKMAGALALTAALAMGSVPAFATASVSTETSEFSDNGSTEVKAEIKKDLNPAIKATVPLNVTVTFGSQGSTEVVGPTSGAYKIHNSGTGTIKVKEVELTDINTFFKTMVLVDDGNGNYTDADGNAPTTNAIMFTYTTTGNDNYLIEGHKLSDAKTSLTDKAIVPTAKGFAEESIASGADLGVTLAGKAYFPAAISQDDITGGQVCKIKYTIGS